MFVFWVRPNLGFRAVGVPATLPAYARAMPCWTLSTACMNTLDCLRSMNTMNTMNTMNIMNKSVGGWRKGLTASSLHSHDFHCPLLHHLSQVQRRGCEGPVVGEERHVVSTAQPQERML